MTSVENLKIILFNRFNRLTLHEKIEIKNKGRPIPDIIISQEGTSKNKKYIRSFNSEWYKKIKWLCGCENRNALFCFPCLIFGGDTVWTDSGFTNISRIKEKCEKHEITQKHMDNVISFSLLGKVNIAEQLSEADRRASKIKHNEQVKKNCEILSKIIDCIKFCGKFELALCGDDESYSSENPGVFKGLIHFISTFDPSLQNHFDSNSVFKGTAKTIQNELLQYMLEVCQDHIASEINETSYVAVMADDTTDVSEHTQTVVMFRYELHGIVFERFWGFFNPENVNANGLSKGLLNEISKVLKENSNKLIAQTYDGANVMKGEQGSVRHEIQQVYQNAHFIHCYAHQLNLIIKHATSSIKSVRLFFSNISGIATFFSQSPQRLAILDRYINKHIPRSSNASNFNLRTVNTVFENKDPLIKCFEELQSLKTTDSTIQASTGFLALLKNDTFLFWLKLFDEIMPHVEILYDQMQVRNVDAIKIEKALNEFYKEISKIHDLESCGSASNSKLIESKEVCYIIFAEAQERFVFTNHLTAAKFFYQENFGDFNKELPIYEIQSICKVYPDIVQGKLETELRCFYSRKEFHGFKGLLELLNMLDEENLASVFSETIKLIKILITIPMTTTEPERCFSTSKRVKTYLRNTMNQERLTALSMISIEKKMISQIKNFNDKVIEKFCNEKNRRMDFVFQ